MVLPRTEAELRVKEALCASPNSQASLNTVADLKALLPAAQAAFLNDITPIIILVLAIRATSRQARPRRFVGVDYGRIGRDRVRANEG